MSYKVFELIIKVWLGIAGNLSKIVLFLVLTLALFLPFLPFTIQIWTRPQPAQIWCGTVQINDPWGDQEALCVEVDDVKDGIVRYTLTDGPGIYRSHIDQFTKRFHHVPNWDPWEHQHKPWPKISPPEEPSI